MTYNETTSLSLCSNFVSHSVWVCRRELSGRSVSRPQALTLAARSACWLIPLLGCHLPCLTPHPPLLWTRWLGTYRNSLFSLHFLFIPLPLGIKGNEGNTLTVCQVRWTMEKWKKLEDVCDSSWDSSHFAGVRLAQLFEMAPLACRLWGRALYEDAWVGKQTIKVSESSLTL